MIVFKNLFLNKRKISHACQPKPVITNGFSLIETLVALLIIGVVVGGLFKLQGQLYRGTFSAHALFERLPIMRNAFVRADQEEWYTKSKSKHYTDEGPQTNITYKFEKLSDKSTFKKIKNLYSEQVDMQWPELKGPKKEIFVSYRFYVEPSAEKSGAQK
jgi:prepilin-type N-terminal cleavage/methylation domain-containing protein